MMGVHKILAGTVRSFATAVLSLRDPNDSYSSADGTHEIRLQLPATTGKGAPSAEKPLPGEVNYLIGNDPSKWITNLKIY